MNSDDLIEAWDVLDLLAGLVDKSLVFVDSAHGERHRMLETVREYARQMLVQSGEAEVVQRRHAENFLAFVEGIEPRFESPEQKDLLDRMEEEHDNLRVAFRFWLGAPDGAGPAASMGAALYWFWYIRGYWTEGRELLQLVFARRAEVPAAATARLGKALYAAGVMAYTQGDYAAAEALYLDARETRRAGGDRKGEAAVVSALGLLAKERSDLKTARVLYEESLALRREIDDRGGIAGSLNNLGVLLADIGEHEEAMRLFEECLEIQRDLGNAYAIATAVGNLGRSALYLGDTARAREMFEESLELRRDLGDMRGRLLAQFSLGFLAQEEGKHEEANALLRDCLEQGQAIGDIWVVAHATLGLGNEALDDGDYLRALDLYRQSLRIRFDMGDRSGAGEVLVRIAQLLTRTGRPAEAARFFGAGDTILTSTGMVYPERFLKEWSGDAARAWETLGPEAFDAALEEGGRMSLDDAVAGARAL